MTFSDIQNSYNTKYKVIKANSYYLHNQMTIKNINFNNKIKTKVILQEYVLVFNFIIKKPNNKSLVIPIVFN